MAAVTSISAGRGLRPPNGGSGLFSSNGDGDSRVGTIMSVPNDDLARSIGLAVVAGYAVMFSPTSDGGAVGIHVWRGSNRDRVYCTTVEAFADALSRIEDAAAAKLAGVPGAGVMPLQRSNTSK